MSINTKTVAELRQRTGAGMVDCKVALDEAAGDIEKAIEVLKKKGAIKAAKKSAERTASEGVIVTYVHHNGKLAAMLELACETDFVARTDDFKALAQELALQVAAMDPTYVSPDAIPPAELDKKRAEFSAELADDKKPDEIKQKIVEGKLNKWYSEMCLTKQTLIKDDDKTVEQLVNEKIAKLGEKIAPTRFVRMCMAASHN